MDHVHHGVLVDRHDHDGTRQDAGTAHRGSVPAWLLRRWSIPWRKHPFLKMNLIGQSNGGAFFRRS